MATDDLVAAKPTEDTLQLDSLQLDSKTENYETILDKEYSIKIVVCIVDIAGRATKLANTNPRNT